MNFRTPATVLSIATAGAVLAAPATSQDPYSLPDDSWISIDGTVEEVMDDAFVLDFGDGTIKVDMDDADRDAEAYDLLAGTKVSVTGEIDDDFFDSTEIEASSVYIEDLGTYFFSAESDFNEDYVIVTNSVTPSNLVLQGTVTSTSDDEFVMNTGAREIRVELEELGYSVLDDEGYQRIEIGDQVSVTGEMDADFLEGREVVASKVTVLRR